jgi:hypothetical protein
LPTFNNQCAVAELCRVLGPQGAVGAAFIGVAAGYRNLIGIDIGGTSAPAATFRNGAPREPLPRARLA